MSFSRICLAGGERGGYSHADIIGAVHDVVPKRAGARIGGHPMNLSRPVSEGRVNE